MPIQVRTAVTPDIPTLVEMMREFYAESDHSLDFDWALKSFSALLSDRAHGDIWLAFHEENPVGYVVLTQRFSMEFGGLDGFIDDMFVRPSFRRTGVGKALLEALWAESKARGLLALHVEVGPENVAANALYGRFGMRDKGRCLLSVKIESTRSSTSNAQSA